jgi:hypothetical protein
LGEAGGRALNSQSTVGGAQMINGPLPPPEPEYPPPEYPPPPFAPAAFYERKPPAIANNASAGLVHVPSE